MQEPPVPSDETHRLEILHSCGIVDAPLEPEFEDLVRLAANICEAPIALLTIIGEERQWFKAKVNIKKPKQPRSVSICAHAINKRSPLIVSDLTRDARFADNPIVVNPPHARFYAGVPLCLDGGSAIGTLCILGPSPRELSAAHATTLESLGRHAARELALRSELLRTRRASMPAPGALAPGDVVGAGHRIVRKLGAGGIGVVYEARSPRGERVAIKCLLDQLASSSDLVERFAREARILMSVRSPHVAGIVDAGNLDAAHGGFPFIAMEYLEGEDLRAVLERERHVAAATAARWIVDACAGLVDVHARGIIHRDLKPANLFKTTAPPMIKVLDFGVAKMESPSEDDLTRTGAAVGSLRYMAPEQMLGLPVDARADVWSLGVVLHQLVTGKHPFSGDNQLQICMAIMSSEPVLLRAMAPDAPEALEHIIARCLAKPAANRFDSAAQLKDALGALA
jgi:tRNA A-37 threonylcarbamoyl transferase component Bud32